MKKILIVGCNFGHVLADNPLFECAGGGGEIAIMKIRKGAESIKKRGASMKNLSFKIPDIYIEHKGYERSYVYHP